MKCEACGGDGLIEVGAYRGDDSPETRTCSLCGGVMTVSTSTDRAIAGLQALGHAASKAGITLKESISGVRRTITVIEDAQVRAKRTADEYDERLRRENEQRQRQAETERCESTIRSTDAIMNEFLRDRFKD